MELEQYAQTLMQDLRDHRKLAQLGKANRPEQAQWYEGRITAFESIMTLETSRLRAAGLTIPEDPQIAQRMSNIIEVNHQPATPDQRSPSI
ncbi:MAG: hypothetical protein CENE_00009 [Candidatus Celerinatantimonas neptuna]|nr:MAG: hypothetical protein CENE_00009 [Candidatus Celerinatantimonas neptuna]